MHKNPCFCEESQLYNQGFKVIAGVDEVGRGTIAGPVLAGIIILPKNTDLPWINLIKDSNKLSQKKREDIVCNIQQSKIYYETGISSSKEIDQIGIVEATHLAIIRALEKCKLKPDFLLLDGGLNPKTNIKKQTIVKGDNSSMSIAAASIIAKVTRDKIMEKFDQSIPGYEFAKHKGYLTKLHMQKLKNLGPSEIHRKSFHPVTEYFK